MTQKTNVLFLDDEQSILNSVKRVFLNSPYGVMTTTRPAEAMELLSQGDIKVVLSDHRMPGLTGVQFLKNVKEQNPDVVRILFTGYADFSAAEEAINLGEVYRFISKPWDTGDLRETVRHAIMHYDLIMENRRLFLETTKKKEELEVLTGNLRRMCEVQKEFTSTVSHELRTPLASIKSTVDLVLSGAPGKLTADQTDFLNKTKDNVDRLSRLINDILDLTKMETGKIEFQIAPNDIGQLVRDIVDMHEPVADDKGLFIKIEPESEWPSISFDADKLHQVFDNLVGNAIKFTETGGVTISSILRVDENHLEVCVADTGPGIKDEDKDKLFLKFQQLGDSRKYAGGTGLGLAICKEIINRHGGKIWVESRLGQGCRFYFLMPLEERRKESP